MKELKEDFYKGRKSEICTGGVGTTLFMQPVIVERSFGNMCLLRLTKCGDYGIYFMTPDNHLTDPITFEEKKGNPGTPLTVIRTAGQQKATEVYENLILDRKHKRQQRLMQEQKEKELAERQAKLTEKRDEATRELVKQRDESLAEIRLYLQNGGVNKKLFEAANKYYLTKQMLQQITFLIK